MFFDNRGVGYSDAPKGLYSTSQMAQDTLELLDALGWTSDVHVAGVSMGGMISLELVLADAKRFSSLVLTSTNAGRSPPMLVTVSFLARVILMKDPDLRIKLITETLYPAVRIRMPFPLLNALGDVYADAPNNSLRNGWNRHPITWRTTRTVKWWRR